jgi:hypothetical protein
MKLTEKDLDDAIRRQREEWDAAQFAESTDTRIEPCHLPHFQGCAGPCDQGRRPCTCDGQPMQWADIPSPWRWRIVAAVSAILVVSIAVAFAGWPA